LEKSTNTLEEIKMQSQVSSPHIVQLYGSFVSGTDLWIIMEYLCGSLKDFLKTGPFEEQFCAIILRETLFALEYLHKEGKVHRDIKGNFNILLNKEQIVK
jgi:serine/threonine protein kinase